MIGTLLVHAVVVCWLAFGAGARIAWVSDGDRPGARSLSLLLLSPAAEDAVNQAPRIPEPQRVSVRMTTPSFEPAVLPNLAIEADLRLAGRQPAARDAQIATLDLCHRTYRDEADLLRDVAHVSLRGAVVPGGPIGDAEVDISSGDRSRALLALHCLQAFGTLPSAARLN